MARVETLHAQLAEANAGFEKHERLWYLEMDRSDRLESQLAEANKKLAELEAKRK
jgi:hypothetical protein